MSGHSHKNETSGSGAVVYIRALSSKESAVESLFPIQYYSEGLESHCITRALASSVELSMSGSYYDGYFSAKQTVHDSNKCQ